MHSIEMARQISMSLELAVLLEVSAEKPGNVNRIAGFGATRYEHFLASAVAVAPSFYEAARRGIAVSEGKIASREVHVGQIVKDSVIDANRWQHGGNTLLGTVILLSPMAVAAGMTSNKEEAFCVPKIREKLGTVVEATTPEDAVDVYEAIRAAEPGGLGQKPELDLNDPDSTRKILEERIPLIEVFKRAAEYDSICSEWINNYPITFDVAYPYLMSQLEKNDDVNKATVHTFLKVLAEYPDTLIARKLSLETAREVSREAREILKQGGLETSGGREKISGFDLRLREGGNLLNPGTTADLIAAALALCVLGGYRP